jgi:hypothetical protein
MNSPLISMTELGNKGRFGNQLIQYMFLRTYARQYDFELQTPAWIGQDLFGFDDPPVSQTLPKFEDPYEFDESRMVIPRRASPVSDVDFSGFFQYPTSYYAPHRSFIQDLFVPVNSIRQPLTVAFHQLKGEGRTVVGLHIRRGDYGYGSFYITPVAWYVALLDQLLPKLNNPVVFVATDAPKEVLPELRKFAPVTCRDLGVHLPIAPFYPDFYLLSQADVTVIPNSSFSFAAAMLNKKLKVAYRSHLSHPLEAPPFRQFDPWNATMLERAATVENHPMIPGIGRTVPPKFFSRKFWTRRRAA